jgi:hypothetical protein
VLGGDIFDFRWSTLACTDRTARAAEQWLRKLVQPRPECRFDFLLGNHDCHPRLVERLMELSADAKNFHWHADVLRSGGDIFLHGDILSGRVTPRSLARRRAKWASHGPTAPWRQSAYQAAVNLRLHGLVGRIANPRPVVAFRLLQYLKHLGHGPESGLRRVFFGHTHVAMSNYQFRQVTFHNGGAPMAGLAFRLVEITADHASAEIECGE